MYIAADCALIGAEGTVTQEDVHVLVEIKASGGPLHRP